MMSVTRVTAAMMSRMVARSLSHQFGAHARDMRTDALIRSLISFAADAERCASVLTSPATTAKPLPCSPARAASTAAFNARILV